MKFRSCSLSASAISILLMTVSSFAHSEIRLAHVLGADHSWQKAAEGFAEQVAADTEGRVTIGLYPGGQLGQEKEIVEGFILGSSEAGIIGCGSFQPLVPEMSIIEAPYAWPSREIVYAALDGKLGDYLAEKLHNNNVTLLGYWENGFRHITNNRGPINEPADLAGLKIRVTPDPIRLETFKALGAEPAPLAFGELYSALQQGVFDAQENPAEIVYTYSLYEVQKYLSQTGHIYGSACLVMGNSQFDSLSEADQSAVRDAAAVWRDNQRKMSMEGESVFLEKLKDTGMQINEVDTAPFIEAVQPVWEKYKGAYGEELIGLLEEYRK